VTALILAVFACVVLASVLALAEASISRLTPVRAHTLREQGYRNGPLLERIQSEPARYLNGIYLSVMFAQNGSAILVAILTEHYFDDIGIPVVSIAFTLAYFVVVEAMAKTFAILHSDRVALTLAPFVWVLGRALSLPTRVLIGLANVLLPGKGLKQGPFVIEQEIRSLAEVGHREGEIEAHEKEIIHSVFHFGDLVVRQIMVPRPDIVAIDLIGPLDAAAELIVQRGFTRIPAYRNDLDHIEGIVHAKDVLNLLHERREDVPLAEVLRPVRFVPESKPLADLLREMQTEKFHLSIVIDEYGLVSGLVTLEDLLEQLVGEIGDEHDREAPDFAPLGGGRYRVNAVLPIIELNELLHVDLPHDRWNTVGGLIFSLAGRIPTEGATFVANGLELRVEKVQGRRILTAVITQLGTETPSASQSTQEPEH
jgi:CBS domain containing-hemolysin-like protein